MNRRISLQAYFFSNLPNFFNVCEREYPSERSGRMSDCILSPCTPVIRKIRWISMRDKVPSGRGESKLVEIPPATVETGNPFRKLGGGHQWNLFWYCICCFKIRIQRMTYWIRVERWKRGEIFDVEPIERGVAISTFLFSLQFLFADLSLFTPSIWYQGDSIKAVPKTRIQAILAFSTRLRYIY